MNLIHISLKEQIISNGLKYALATGNWGWTRLKQWLRLGSLKC
jgi:hypothetical protein